MTAVDNTRRPPQVDGIPWSRNYTVTQFRERFSHGWLTHTVYIS